MAWTPENLTDPKFVQTQLTPLDRGNALLTMNRNLSSVQSKLTENKAALDQVQNQTNGPYSFGTVRAARSAATAAAAQGDPNAAALQIKYEELQAKRSELNGQADRLISAIQSGEEAIQTSQIAISNLEAAGAVPPGTNQFTPPPGYNSTINPPAEVPASQNPTNITTTTENVQNSTAISVNPNSDPNTNIGAEAQDVTGFEPLQEPPSTADEFDGIDTQIANNENGLQEPPLLSDEEIEQQLRLASAPQEIITSPDSITENVFDPRQDAQESVFDPRQEVTESVFDPTAGGNGQGISTALNNTRSTATKDDSANFQQKPDWRARLSLSPGANYLYKVEDGKAGILEPLQATDGVIFPYTPGISVTYSAGYDASELIHSNYKVYQYKGSSVDTVSITADFTAQDTTEANYLLAVIHFFRSVTKMFYGQDRNPNNGVPPPLCYLSGFGAYTFDAHPLVVTNFTYTTPTDVDYIRAGSQTNQPGVNIAQQKPILNSFTPSVTRKSMSGLTPKVPNFTTQNTMINSEATYVPTKIQLQITCIPIVTRNDISNKFSLKEYATGALLRGSKRSGGGIW